MMEKLSSRHFIKVPPYITCYLCEDRNFLLLVGKIGVKVIKLDVKVLLFSNDKSIYVTKETVRTSNILSIKETKHFRSLTKTEIKKSLLDVSRKSYKKLKLNGVGFRVSNIELEGEKFIKLSLGLSHDIFYRVPEDIEIIVTSSTRFIVSGNSSDRVSEVSCQIRKNKIPDVYKGKGILYDDEKVILKEFKKV